MGESRKQTNIRDKDHMMLIKIGAVAMAALAAAAADSMLNNSMPVQVDLYFESLCPYCRHLITNQFLPNYDNLMDVMNVSLFPYGNANRRSVPGSDGLYNYTCQHGPDECVANRIYTAALDKYGQGAAFKFVACLEASSDPASIANGLTCGNQHGVNYTAVRDLGLSDDGNRLEAHMADLTDALNPSHQYVPWIVFDGVTNQNYMNAASNNLKKVVCELYERKNGMGLEACTPYTDKQTHTHKHNKHKHTPKHTLKTHTQI